MGWLQNRRERWPAGGRTGRQRHSTRDLGGRIESCRQAGGGVLLGSICSMFHWKQLEVSGLVTCPGSCDSSKAQPALNSDPDMAQWDQPRSPKKSAASRGLLGEGVRSPGLLLLPAPDPWALPIWDWQAGCAPGRGGGAQAGWGVTHLSTQPSTARGRWQAGASLQPLTGCRNPARWRGPNLQRPQKKGLGRTPGLASLPPSRPTSSLSTATTVPSSLLWPHQTSRLSLPPQPLSPHPEQPPRPPPLSLPAH